MSHLHPAGPRALSSLAVAVVVVTLGWPAPVQASDGAGTPSNLGLCSPYLADQPAVIDPLTGETLGGNARSGVNLLIKRYGLLLPDQLANPGQLYRIRAHEHPTATAEEECLQRGSQ